MIRLPAFKTLSQAHLYADSVDARLLYVDLLEPAPVHGSCAARWSPMAGNEAYLSGEVRFGPGKEGFGRILKAGHDQRLLPMPWEIAPVFAWYRTGEDVQLAARGKTSGFGSSNAVLNGSAPVRAMLSPLFIAAELVCQARLARAQVSGKGRPAAVEEALKTAPLGRRADWRTTLADVLVDLLSGLLGAGELTLWVQLENFPADTDAQRKAELRHLALLEWAHRLQRLLAPDLTLAAPAALIPSIDLKAPLSLDLAWMAGSSVTLRSVRVLQPKEADHAVTE
jgi:hypothetical protein